jgi:hypothetical protein
MVIVDVQLKITSATGINNLLSNFINLNKNFLIISHVEG